MADNYMKNSWLGRASTLRNQYIRAIMHGIKEKSMSEIVIRRKRMRELPPIIILTLLEIIVAIVLVMASGIISKIFCIMCMLGAFLLIYFSIEELFKLVKICNDDIFIKYGRTITSDRIIECEYTSKQRVYGNLKADVITLRYDQHNFFMVDSYNCTNYDALMEYIIKHDIPVKTDNQREFSRIRKSVKNRIQNSTSKNKR